MAQLWPGLAWAAAQYITLILVVAVLCKLSGRRHKRADGPAYRFSEEVDKVKLDELTR